MSDMDFNGYDDVLLYHKYDGFISPDGKYYKVKLRKSDMRRDSHNHWAQKFIEEKLNVSELKIRTTCSMLYGLSQINGPAEILVHYFGYIYYSHDPIYYKPIIKLPNHKIAGHKATERQLDALFELMLINNEKPLENKIFLDEEENEYNDIDQNLDYGSLKR